MSTWRRLAAVVEPASWLDWRGSCRCFRAGSRGWGWGWQCCLAIGKRVDLSSRSCCWVLLGSLNLRGWQTGSTSECVDQLIGLPGWNLGCGLEWKFITVSFVGVALWVEVRCAVLLLC